MPKLTPPVVPPELRKLLLDYPENIGRLPEVLDDFAESRPRLQLFDEAIWVLENRLGAFIQEATSELIAAEASGDAIAIEKAERKKALMFLAKSKNGGMRIGLMDDRYQIFHAS